jgi:phage pi2 protein 07
MFFKRQYGKEVKVKKLLSKKANMRMIKNQNGGFLYSWEKMVEIWKG